MLTKIVTLAVAAIAVVAPPSQASHTGHACGIAVAGRTVTGGDTWTGVVYGAVVASGENVSIRCYLTVDGVVVPGGSTGTMTGTTATLTATTVSYRAPDSQSVEVCTEWTAGSEGGTSCDISVNATAPVPPGTEALFDAFWDLWWGFWSVADPIDPMDCPILASLSPGVPGIVDVMSDGDVVVLGNWLWDCPPYDV